MRIKSFIKNGICCIVLLAQFSLVKAQGNTKFTIEQYINIYKEVAKDQMKEYKIPASIILAQAINESSWGNSDLAVKANNHFGIKCHDDWKGETFHKDDETKDECFRKYNDPVESFKDHSLFLTTKSRYSSLFKLDITDYKGWANELKKCGYATNPKYPELLINLIEKYALNQYDTAQSIIASTRKGTKHIKEKIEEKPVDHQSLEKRNVLLNNNVKYIITRNGDTFLSLASEYKMGVWQLYRYNDMSKNDQIIEGQIMYLQPKRRRSSEHKQHIVKEGETLFYISQIYAVKTRHLHRLNPELNPDGDITPGQVIWLQKQRKGN